MRLVATNVRLDPTDYRDLNTLAHARGISVAEAVRAAIAAYLRGWRGDASETAPPSGERPASSGSGGFEGTLALARVRGNELVLPAPVGLDPNVPVLIHVLGPGTPSDLETLKTQRAVIAAVAADVASVDADPPVAMSDEDREIYR